MTSISALSIIIPVYNDPNLKRCLASIAMQTFQDVEVIIVDDHSSIDYSSTIDSFSNLLNINYIRNSENRGCGYSRNVGIENATSKFICFMDSDDTLYSSIALEELYGEIMSEDNIDLLVGCFYEEYYYNKDGHTYRKLVNHDNDVTWLFSKIYRRDFLLENNISFPDSSANEDLGFNSLCFACAGEDRVKFSDTYAYLWHSNPNSITRNSNGDFKFKGLRGFIQNHIWFYNECVKRNLQSNDAVRQSVDGMVMMYIYYINISRNRNEEELREYALWVKHYFNEVWDKLPEIKYEIVCQRYFSIMEQNSSVSKLYIPNITIYQFVKMFD